jgi:hypothetical protein
MAKSRSVRPLDTTANFTIFIGSKTRSYIPRLPGHLRFIWKPTLDDSEIFGCRSVPQAPSSSAEERDVGLLLSRNNISCCSIILAA